MEAHDTKFRELIEGNKQFQIPLFQRPYSWDESHWMTLWDDLISLCEEEFGTYHFLGPIVTLTQSSTPEGVSSYVVIDGQQRLTTLMILIAALRDHLRKQDDAELHSEELHDFLTNRFKQGEIHYKVLPTQADRDSFVDVIEAKDIGPDGGIPQAYEYFNNRIAELRKNRKLPFNALKEAIFEGLRLVSINLDDQHDNPYLIFESLNYKGEPLTQADLVRNYFFMNLPPEQRDRLYNDHWFPVQNRFKQQNEEKYLDELTNGFWYYLRKDGNQVNQKQVYQFLKFKLERGQTSYEDALKDLLRYTEHYFRIRFPGQEPDPKLSAWFVRFQRLDFTTSYPFLLNVYEDYQQGQLSLEQFESILEIIESYFVRRLVCGIPTNALNRVFNVLYRQVAADDSDQDFVTRLRETLKGYQRSQLWPNDDMFKDNIVSRPIYSKSRNDRTKLLLESIERALTKEVVEPASLSIEHVMPQTLTDEWRAVLGSDPSAEHERWVNTFGNLTLTGYNAELSNHGFDEKRAHFEKSGLQLNRYFQNVDRWDVDAIKRRGEWLAEIAVTVWPR